jgi:hypothetical protein
MCWSERVDQCSLTPRESGSSVIRRRRRPVSSDCFRASARRCEGRGPNDRVAVPEQSARTCWGSANVPEAAIEKIRAMRRRDEPRRDDVPSAHLPPRTGEKILPERRISVAGSSHGRSQVAAARRVRELPAGCDALAFQSGSVSERRPLLEACTAIVEASPVDETTDRTRLDCGRGCPIVRRLAHASWSEKRAPGATGTIGLTDDEKGRQRADDGRRQSEPNWSYRSRHHHGSHRAPEADRRPCPDRGTSRPPHQ